jgi:hypothetical protein
MKSLFYDVNCTLPVIVSHNVLTATALDIFSLTATGVVTAVTGGYGHSYSYSYCTRFPALQ